MHLLKINFPSQSTPWLFKQICYTTIPLRETFAEQYHQGGGEWFVDTDIKIIQFYTVAGNAAGLKLGIKNVEYVIKAVASRRNSPASPFVRDFAFENKLRLRSGRSILYC